MYLKSIDIQGFKSFADQTKLEFLPPEEGKKSITSIVGPNGSGKSNISDAIRWVMGEQSMSKIRAKTNEDIIFSGSEKKRKMSRASVEITIDNSNDELDMEYDEVRVARRYYRSGESQYIINGEDVRLLDVKLLLAKAQFAQASYSVIGQGMVDKMILQSPAERKDFFDEAVGIKEHQIKRHQAWLKLNRTKDNIDEVEIMLDEIRPRLDRLSKQVEKLKKRKELEQSLRELQESYYSTVWKRNNENIKSLKETINNIGTDCENTKEELESMQKKLSKLAKERSRQENFEELKNKHQKLVNEKNRLEQKRAVLKGKLQTEYNQAGKQNLSWLENKVDDLQSNKEDIESQLKETKKELKEVKQKLNQEEKELKSLKNKRNKIVNEIQEIKSKISKAQSEEEVSQYIGIKAVQSILENRHQFGEVYGTVAQLGEVEPKYQLALDIAAGGHLSSVVVEDDKIAQECIDYLRDNRLGYATFLPLNKINPRYKPNNLQQYFNHPCVYDLAVNLASFDGKFYDVFSYALGSTLIVENVQTAREVGIGNIRMVTLDGDVLNKSGSMKGGHRKKKRKLSFSQSYERSDVDIKKQQERLGDKKDELDKLEVKLEKKKKQKVELETNQQTLENKLNLLQKEKEGVKEEVDELKQDLSLADVSPEEYSGKMEEIKDKKQNVESEIKKYKDNITSIEEKIDEFNQKEEEKKQKIFSLQDKMQEIQKNLNELTDKKNKKEVQLAKLETKQEDLEQEVEQEMNTSIKSIIKKGAEKIDWESKSDVYDKIQDIKYKLSLIGGIDEEVVEEYEETKTRYDELSDQLKDLNKAMNDSKELIEELDQIMETKRREVFKDIRSEFKRYFKKLFGGGDADLKKEYGIPENGGLVDEEKVEEQLVGIEIEASPPGKKIDSLEVLSGGEKTLTSIALICAILNVNPAPFVVLDEVEAALDEANSSRFVEILHELSEESQFILITHNRTTMHAADALYGVTMGDDGVSNVLSIKLEKAEQMTEEMSE